MTGGAARDELPWPRLPSVTKGALKDLTYHEEQQRAPVPGAFTFPVFSLSQDHVERSHLGLEWLHKLGVNRDLVLSRVVLSGENGFRSGQVIAA